MLATATATVMATATASHAHGHSHCHRHIYPYILLLICKQGLDVTTCKGQQTNNISLLMNIYIFVLNIYMPTHRSYICHHHNNCADVMHVLIHFVLNIYNSLPKHAALHLLVSYRSQPEGFPNGESGLGSLHPTLCIHG